MPTLLGYIDKARSEKNYATAQTIRVAVQAELAEKYSSDSTHAAGVISKGDSYGTKALSLAGNMTEVSAFSFSYGDNYEIISGTVQIGTAYYHLSSNNWSVSSK